MVNVAARLVLLPRRLVRERASPRKAVVRAADRFRVRERLAAQLGREPRCEVFEGAELGAQRDGWLGGRRVVVVEDYGEDGLRAAGVLDGLGCEEDVLRCGWVVDSVEGGFGAGAGCFAGPFEEEDYAVDGAVGGGIC